MIDPVNILPDCMLEVTHILHRGLFWKAVANLYVDGLRFFLHTLKLYRFRVSHIQPLMWFGKCSDKYTCQKRVKQIVTTNIGKFSQNILAERHNFFDVRFNFMDKAFRSTYWYFIIFIRWAMAKTANPWVPMHVRLSSQLHYSSVKPGKKRETFSHWLNCMHSTNYCGYFCVQQPFKNVGSQQILWFAISRAIK